MVETARDLLVQYFPSAKMFLLLGLPSLILAFCYLYLAGFLKKYKKWKTGYSRKVFHFFVFVSASIIQAKLTLTGTIVFGCSVSIVVFYAILKGNGNILYEALAREKDAPRKTYFIIAPYFATLIGGIFSNLIFTLNGALIGYLATGFGDAVGEPFGTRFGRHKYKVPSLTNVISYRSYEGSAAVFIATFLAGCFGLLLLQEPISAFSLLKVFAIAFACTLVEAISPHGWDNFTTQVTASGMFYFLFV